MTAFAILSQNLHKPEPIHGFLANAFSKTPAIPATKLSQPDGNSLNTPLELASAAGGRFGSPLARHPISHGAPGDLRRRRSRLAPAMPNAERRLAVALGSGTAAVPTSGATAL